MRGRRPSPVPARAALALLGALVGPALAAPAQAGPNDFRLNATRNGEGILFATNGAGFVANPEAWTSLVDELGFVFAPRLASPAETLGHAGFHVGVLWSGTFVSSDQSYWFVTERARATGTPNSVLQTLQLDVRKGLPLSFELGVNLLWLVESEMFAPGMELRWALHEGYDYTPDLGIRGSVNQLVGNRDLNLTVVGLDVVLSRSFGVGGVVNIGPYLSYSVLMVAASSRVVDPTPTDITDVGRNLVLPKIEATQNVNHKATLGVRLLFSILNVTVQGELELLRDTPTGKQFIGQVATISTKLGLDY
jgi:hypothetical protein